MALLLRALNMTVARDTWPGDVAVCPAGTSHASDEWLVTMGRVETLKDPPSIGSCFVETTSTGARSFDAGNLTAMTPPTWGSGEDCSYSGDDLPASSKYAYVLPAHTADGCCKSCSADKDCARAWYLPGAEEQTDKNFVNECFGIHITAVDGHATAPGLSVEVVEAHFDDKVGAMKTFDWFMDFNVAFYTNFMDDYLARLDGLGLAWLPATWFYEDETFYSALFHVPGSQVVVELVAFNSERVASMVGDKIMYVTDANTIAYRPAVIQLEQRMTDDRVAQMQDVASDDRRLLASSVGRAASDLDAVRDFYVTGMGATMTQDLTSADVARRCFNVNGTSADVCFTRRDDSTTKGPFKPKDMETMLHEAHEYWLGSSPSCAMDRWADNHYAIDLEASNDAFMRYIIDNNVTYACPDPDHSPSGNKGVHYVFDPTGWGIQMDTPENVVMPNCETALSDANNQCKLGSPDGKGGCLYWCNGGQCNSNKHPHPEWL